MALNRESPWLTVVTVHKDDIEGLGRTLASIDCQQLDGVEHLVIDSSADQPSVLDCVAQSGQLRTRIHYMAAEGIYSAMNRGLEVATGQYVLFTNAGDTLADPMVLSRIRDVVFGAEPTWLFGSLILTTSRGRSVEARPWSYSEHKARRFRSGRFPQQPGMIVDTELLRSLGGFDPSFTVAADYRSMLSLANSAEPVSLSFSVARFGLGGASTVQWKRSLREAYRARCEQYELTGMAAVVEFLKSTPVLARAVAARALRRV